MLHVVHTGCVGYGSCIVPLLRECACWRRHAARRIDHTTATTAPVSVIIIIIIIIINIDVIRMIISIIII